MTDDDTEGERVDDLDDSALLDAEEDLELVEDGEDCAVNVHVFVASDEEDADLVAVLDAVGAELIVDDEDPVRLGEPVFDPLGLAVPVGEIVDVGVALELGDPVGKLDAVFDMDAVPVVV